eukprot:192790_1
MSQFSKDEKEKTLGNYRGIYQWQIGKENKPEFPSMRFDEWGQHLTLLLYFNFHDKNGKLFKLSVESAHYKYGTTTLGSVLSRASESGMHLKSFYKAKSKWNQPAVITLWLESLNITNSNKSTLLSVYKGVDKWKLRSDKIPEWPSMRFDNNDNCTISLLVYFNWNDDNGKQLRKSIEDAHKKYGTTTIQSIIERSAQCGMVMVDFCKSIFDNNTDITIWIDYATVNQVKKQTEEIKIDYPDDIEDVKDEVKDNNNNENNLNEIEHNRATFDLDKAKTVIEKAKEGTEFLKGIIEPEKNTELMKKLALKLGETIEEHWLEKYADKLGKIAGALGIAGTFFSIIITLTKEDKLDPKIQAEFDKVNKKLDAISDTNNKILSSIDELYIEVKADGDPNKLKNNYNSLLQIYKNNLSYDESAFRKEWQT